MYIHCTTNPNFILYLLLGHLHSDNDKFSIQTHKTIINFSSKLEAKNLVAESLYRCN